MVGYLFAGQGSQYVGMGKDLYDTFPESRSIFDTADSVLGFSLSAICFEGSAQELTRTDICQPALLTVSIAAWEAFRKVYRVPCTGYRGAAGLSLGEYSALAAAGALAFPDAVRLLRFRGQFMEEAAAQRKGGMLSLIGLDLEAVRDLCRELDLEIANRNCPGQIVISGDRDRIEAARTLAKERGAKLAVPLNVSGAFHSSFMARAASRLAEKLKEVTLADPQFEVIANVTAQPVTGVTEIRENLTRQVAGSVLWEDSMRFLLARGVKRFFEFGPGKVLKGLMRRIDSSVEVVTIEKAEDIENLKSTSVP